MLFVFKKVISPLCSFCKSEDETPLHLFFECTLTQNLWKQLSSFCRQRLNIPTLTPQSAIFGFYEPQNKNEILINHLLLIFKLYLYNARESNKVNFVCFKAKITNIKDIEENISNLSTQKRKKFCKKWNIVKDIF